MKKTSNFRNGLLKSYIALSILPMCVITVFTLIYLVPKQIKETLRFTTSNCEYLNSTVNSSILEIQSLLRALFIRKEGGSYITRYLTEEVPQDEYAKLQRQRIFNDIFVELSVFRTSLNGIVLRGRNGETFSYYQNYPLDSEDDHFSGNVPLSVSRPFIKGTHLQFGHEKDAQVFTIILPLWTDNLGSIAGSLQVDYSIAEIEEICSKSSLRMNERVLVFAPGGEIIYDSHGQYLDSSVSPELLALLTEEQGEVSQITWEDSSYYLVRSPEENTLGITTVTLIPRGTLLSSSLTVTIAVSVITLIVIICVLLSSRYLSVRFSYPLKSILSRTAKIGEGNLNTRFPDFSYREFQELSAGLNQMVSTIQTLINQKYILTLNKKEAQMKALLAQINPHFINNTLEIISGIAYEHKEPQIYQTVNALGSMLHYTIKTDSDLVPLRSEINYINKLLSIYNTRFESSLHLRTELAEERLLDLPVPKLVLQPIIENCVKYRVPEDQLFIDLKIFLEKDRLFLSVSDNGMGIPEEKKKALQALLSLEPEDALKNQNQKSIGLLNIHMRILLQYGFPYGLTIESQYKKGTCITICLPGGKE